MDKYYFASPPPFSTGRHKDPLHRRAPYRRTVDTEFITTTGDILVLVTADLKDGFVEVATSDGAMLNNEGWKTY